MVVVEARKKIWTAGRRACFKSLDEGVDIGVSQSSEILQSNPNAMAGPFPKEFALATDFSLWHRNNMSPAVKDLVAVLTGPAGRARLTADGVMPPAAR